MDFTAILLIFILVVIIYLFYVYFIATTNRIVNSLYLNQTGGNLDTTITTSPTVTSFSVGLWIYFNSWNTGTSKNIIKMKTDKGNQFLSLDLGDTKPELSTTVTIPESAVPKIIITENFPVQKWVYVIVSVSGSIVDCYLDGRLISSYQLGGSGSIGVAGSQAIVVSYGKNVDAYIYNFERYLYPMDTSTAQTKYYYGAPTASTGNAYNVTVSVTKGGSPITSGSLF